MKFFSKLLLILFLFFNINFVYAEECNDNQIKLLKEQAKAIVVDSEFNMDYVIYGVFSSNTVTVQGLTEDLFIMSKERDIGIFFEDVIDGVATEIVQSTSNKFYVYSYSCPGIALRTINLSLKKYNMYSDYEECDGIEEGELDVCDKFYDGNVLGYEDFVKKVNDYKERKKDIIDVDEIKNSKNYIYIIVGILLLLIIIGVIIIRKKKDNQLD